MLWCAVVSYLFSSRLYHVDFINFRPPNLWILARQGIVVKIPDEPPNASFECGVVGSVDWDTGVATVNLGEAKQSYDRWHEATGGSRCGPEGTS